MSRNMKREHGGGDEDRRNKRQKADGFSEALSRGKFELRLLVSSKAAGAIIGKGGENIKRVRSQFDGQVSVPDSNTPERVLTIVNTSDKVVQMVADIMPRLDDGGGDNSKNDEVRLVVHQSHAGALIGKGGGKIKELREKTHTKVKIFQSCAPQSTDRVVAIGGEPKCIVEAIRHIVQDLKETPIKGPVAPYSSHDYDPMGAPEYGGYLPVGLAAPPGRGGGPPADRYGDRSGGPARGGRPSMPGRGGGIPSMGGRMERAGGERGIRRPEMGLNGRPGFNSGSSNFAPMGGSSSMFSGPGGPAMTTGNFGGLAAGGGQDMYMGGGMQTLPGPHPAMFSGHHASSRDVRGPQNGYAQPVVPQQAQYGGAGDVMQVQTTQVTIPSDLGGTIIGRQGERINRIREESGATITMDAPTGAKDRVITIVGTQTQIHAAQFLLQQCVREYVPSGGQKHYEGAHSHPGPNRMQYR